MIPSEDIHSIQDRLVRANADCEAWRASGMQEKYLEAYFLVEALEVQLSRQLALVPGAGAA